MIFITGGVYQGKLETARRLFRKERKAAQEPVVVDAARGTTAEMLEADIVFNLHLYIKRLLEEQKDPLAGIVMLLSRNQDVILTAAELGCGIVPTNKTDRDYREITGRICCKIAAGAEAVYRVICGVETKIFPVEIGSGERMADL